MSKKAVVSTQKPFMYDVWIVNHRRMAALEELRNKLDTIAEDGKRLKERLLAAAPSTAREFLKESTVIEDLFAYGLSDRKIDVGEYEGMDDCATIKRILKSLHTAWSGAVSVDIVHAEGGRVEVKFHATRI